MEPILNNKRQIAVYLPYRKSDDTLEFFIQKRDEKAPVHANMYSLFGGGIEQNESLEEGLLREVMEELGLRPLAPVYLMHCSTGYGDFYVFIEKVAYDFESKVTIGEGVGGDFMDTNEVLTRADVSPIARVAVEGATWYLDPPNE